MFIIRYFCLMQLYHWANIFRMNPVQFIRGVLLFPFHVITRLAYHPSLHPEVVSNGIKVVKAYWEIPGATLPPPACVKRRLLKLESEVDSL